MVPKRFSQWCIPRLPGAECQPGLRAPVFVSMCVSAARPFTQYWRHRCLPHLGSRNYKCWNTSCSTSKKQKQTNISPASYRSLISSSAFPNVTIDDVRIRSANYIFFGKRCIISTNNILFPEKIQVDGNMCYITV